MNGKPGVLAAMDADRIDAIPKREAFQGGKYLASLNAKSLEARATVEELADAAQFVLDKEWEYGEDQPACARLSAALAIFRGEV